MKKVFLLVSILTICVQSYADFFDQRIYNPESGLTGTYIYTIIQDQDDFLWIGTENGLFKYDGQSFHAHFVDDSISDPFTASFKSSDHRVYFGRQSGSITLWNGLDFKALDTTKSSVDRINGIVEADNGTVWALTQNNGLKFMTESSETFKPIKVPELSGVVAYCMEIFNDILYVGTSEGVLKFNVTDDKVRSLGSVEALDYVGILSITMRKEISGFWVGTADDGLYMLNVTGDKTGKYPDRAFKTSVLVNESVVSIDEAPNLDLWIGTKYNGLYKVNFNHDNSLPVQFSHFKTENGLPGNQIGDLFVDNEETTWCGTLGNGLAQMIEKPLHYFPLSNRTLKGQEVHATIQNTKHEYFFGTNNGIIKGYYPDKSDSLRFITVGEKTFGGMQVTEIAYDIDSSFIIGTAKNGVFRADEELNTITQLDIDINFTVSPVRDIETESSGNFWISLSGHGILKFDHDGKLLQQYSTVSGFYHNEIYAMQIDNAGNVWTAAHSSGLAVIKKNGEVDLLSKNNIFPSRDINDLAIDKDGDIWIATYGNGIFEYTGEEFVRFTRNDGLISNYCNSIIADRDDHIWIGHRQGLSRLDKQTNSITNLTVKDGLIETGFLLGSAFVDVDHNIWLGNTDGVTYLAAPHRSFSYKRLTTHITDVKLFYEEVDLMSFTDVKTRTEIIPEGLEFQYYQHDLTFDYIAVNLRNPDNNLYQYRLRGYENEWSPPVKQTQMTYTNLDPGKYIFEVRQSDNTVYWTDDNIMRTSFVVKPPYWETWWFSTSEVTFLVVLMLTTLFFAKRITNRGVIKFLVYITLFIIFEYVHTQLEPYLEEFAGGAPIFQVMMHALLALVLFPVESYTGKYLATRRAKSEAKAGTENTGDSK
ncbi:MAG: two-component regulator propeller domain-containing protein [Cyclobacteriaceae bacterium]